MKSKIKCPVCANSKNSIFLQHSGSTVYDCERCTVKFISPQPSPKKLADYYKDDYFKGGKRGVRGYRDYKALERNLKHEALLKLDLIKKRLERGRLLDIGAGTGVFADEAKKAGFLVSANDISPFAAKALKKRGIKCYLGPVGKENLPKHAFDAVSAWDVIEHVPEVNEMIDAVAKTLKRGGYLFLTTPDTGSWDARIMGKKWYGYKKIPEHLLFFNRKSISRLLENRGFEVLEICRWGFYRDLDFIVEKLLEYDKSFFLSKRLLSTFSLGKISWFFPLTDFMVIAKKKKKGL